MQVKTSELIDPALDYAVAVADGKTNDIEVHGGNVWYGRVTSGFVVWRPTMNWAQGGPIIEREGIDLYCNVPSAALEAAPTWQTSWRARYSRCGFGTEMMHGTTPLIAAMRCYVASKLGDTVDIPEELCK